MRVGYHTSGMASHALDDALTLVAELGFRAVAITLDHHALNPLAPGFVEACLRVRDRVRALDLLPVVETGARFLLDPRRKHQPTLLDPDPDLRAVRRRFLERAVDAARLLGAPVVSLWSGAPPPGEPAETLDARLVAELRVVCETAARAGVVVGLEPEPGMWVESMEDFDRVVRAVAHPILALTLDVGHAHLTEPEGAAETARRYLDRIANVHLEGMRRGAHEHLLPDEGDLDLADVLGALVRLGYDGPACFELSRHGHDAVNAARRARDFARGCGVL